MSHPDKYVCTVSEWDRSAGCYSVRPEASAPSLDDLILAIAARIAPLGDGPLRLNVLTIQLDQINMDERQRRVDHITHILTR